VDTPVARSADSETSVRDPERQVDTADEDVVKVPETPGALSRLRGSVTALRPSWKALGAYLIYQTMAFAIWVVPILSVFGREHIGTGLQDSRFYQWALEWTPWALSHGVNPLFASSVFAPTGVSLVLVRLRAGSRARGVADHGRVRTARVAQRLARRRPGARGVGRVPRVQPADASVLGVVRRRVPVRVQRVHGRQHHRIHQPGPGLPDPAARVPRDPERRGLPRTGGVRRGFTALLVGLFSISTELFGTATVFGAIAFLGALAFAKEIRRPLLRTGGLMLLSGAIAALLLLPYIHAIFVDAPDKPLRLEHKLIGADLWSFIVPPPQARLGGRTFGATLQRLDAFPSGTASATWASPSS
jgi:hypothetical protein